MTHDAVIEILLGFAVLVGWLSALGIFFMKNPFDRLHFTGPVTTLSSLAVSAAVLLTEPFSQIGVKVILIILLLLGSNSVLAHATAITARARGSGGRKHNRRPK